MAEALYSAEQRGGKSTETVGKVSVTYADTPADLQAEVRRAALLYLGQTGLLYAGV